MFPRLVWEESGKEFKCRNRTVENTVYFCIFSSFYFCTFLYFYFYISSNFYFYIFIFYILLVIFFNILPFYIYLNFFLFSREYISFFCNLRLKLEPLRTWASIDGVPFVGLRIFWWFGPNRNVPQIKENSSKAIDSRKSKFFPEKRFLHGWVWAFETKPSNALYQLKGENTVSFFNSEEYTLKLYFKKLLDYFQTHVQHKVARSLNFLCWRAIDRLEEDYPFYCFM